eukprot:2151927-Rhodomonas_salina.1
MIPLTTVHTAGQYRESRSSGLGRYHTAPGESCASLVLDISSQSGTDAHTNRQCPCPVQPPRTSSSESDS